MGLCTDSPDVWPWDQLWGNHLAVEVVQKAKSLLPSMDCLLRKLRQEASITDNTLAGARRAGAYLDVLAQGFVVQGPWVAWHYMKGTGTLTYRAGRLFSLQPGVLESSQSPDLEPSPETVADFQNGPLEFMAMLQNIFARELIAPTPSGPWVPAKPQSWMNHNKVLVDQHFPGVWERPLLGFVPAFLTNAYLIEQQMEFLRKVSFNSILWFPLLAQPTLNPVRGNRPIHTAWLLLRYKTESRSPGGVPVEDARVWNIKHDGANLMGGEEIAGTVLLQQGGGAPRLQLASIRNKLAMGLGTISGWNLGSGILARASGHQVALILEVSRCSDKKVTGTLTLLEGHPDEAGVQES